MHVKKKQLNDITVCYVDGDIDINSSPDIRNALSDLTGRHVKKIVIDLAGVSYVDSSGLATLVEMLKKTKSYGGKLRLSNLADKVKSLFEITKLEKLFEIFDNAEEALADFF